MATYGVADEASDHGSFNSRERLPQSRSLFRCRYLRNGLALVSRPFRYLFLIVKGAIAHYYYLNKITDMLVALNPWRNQPVAYRCGAAVAEEAGIV